MGGVGLGHILLLMAALALPLLAVRAPARRRRPPAPTMAPPRRRTPPADPLLDIGLDPLVEPWSDDPPVRRTPPG